jgi:GNAT superfamily N-acetyltransferase
MSLYAEYLRERTRDEIFETPEGFATYRYVNDGKSVYIIDLYTTPEVRKLGVASAIADCIAEKAKAKGCLEMLGTVVPSTRNSTISMKVLLAYGMELQSADRDLIIFRKEI